MPSLWNKITASPQQCRRQRGSTRSGFSPLLPNMRILLALVLLRLCVASAVAVDEVRIFEFF